MIKAIFFDLDDTLLDFRRAEHTAILDTLRQLKLPASEATAVRYSEINAAQWRLYEKGEVTREALLTRRYAILFAELGVSRDPEAAQRFYEKQLAASADLLPGAKEVLAALAPQYTLCAVTNGTASIQRSRLEKSGIAAYFEKVFISQELGVQKPNGAFFDRCFDAFPALRREETMIVGDSMTSDMRGGRMAGLVTCYVNPQKKPLPKDGCVDYEIDGVMALPALLKSL